VSIGGIVDRSEGRRAQVPNKVSGQQDHGCMAVNDKIFRETQGNYACMIPNNWRTLVKMSRSFG
jgi:hypothetical protein